MASSIDQQFIEYIVKSLVGKPDAVSIERRIDEKGVLLELSVDPEDLGRVIGKRGATAQSLRTLLRALGTKNDARYNLKIIDTGPPPSARPRDDAPADSTNDSSSSSDDSTAADDSSADDSAAKPQIKDEAGEEPASQAAEIDMAEDEDLPESPREDRDHSDVISRTRAELADLDDLEV